ncbi:DUF4334 domain-containing protein [Nocardioides yefusunii]|uniref:DUF4334 domain-containing protein n=1 Tax=Nocardioides yefusunii TaxID=2500546 RepID=A0ABW1R220_9ACTN|nr:DUF4334 domain-containing protein [Nocardioides yefusunii]
MNAIQAAARFGIIREAEGPAVHDNLEEIWDALETVRPEEILGQWRGFAFDTGHRVHALLDGARWYGKRFDALDDVKPMVCRGEDGELFSDVAAGRGEASLWNIEFRGQVTASMVYDGQAVIDHFKRVDDRTLMGVMNGKARWVLDRGRHFWFGLERD